MNNQSQTESQQLRDQLQSLMDAARLNEKKWRRLDQFEKQLIATRTLPELIRLMLENYKTACETDVVTLVLCDPEYEIRRILERSQPDSDEIPGLVLLEKLPAHDAEPAPYLGPFDAEMERAIFDPWPDACHSMLLLPLMRQGELVGSLNMASSIAERFSADRSTDFVERLANIFSICLENALNHERLNLIGLTDPLTGIFNRRYLETRCQEEAANVRRYRTPLCAMFLDIDKFKRINDTHGHLIGDEVLRTVAGLIKSELRSNDVLARYGGEEFVVLLPQTGQHHACEIAERIRHTIASHPFRLNGPNESQVTISIGIAQVAEEPEGSDLEIAHKLFATADEALYLAKESGRNKVVSEHNRPASVAAKRSLIRMLGFGAA
ncbi:MAG: sensor domain-containing diguanylate cyclase [Nitrosomonadales bacterium]|nr:sensor domain-containing diguanylate cyclase [Nitrosomonadales bacterium]